MSIEELFLAETMTYITCHLSTVTQPPVNLGEDREFLHHGLPLHFAGGEIITLDQTKGTNDRLYKVKWKRDVIRRFVSDCALAGNETVMDSLTRSIATSLQTGELSDSASLNLSILLESHIQLGSGVDEVRKSAKDTADSILAGLGWIEESSKPPDVVEAEAIAEDILDDLTVLKAGMQPTPQQLSYPSNNLGVRVFSLCCTSCRLLHPS